MMDLLNTKPAAGLEMKEAALQPLADYPEATRRDLLKALCDLLEDRDALTLLEQTVR